MGQWRFTLTVASTSEKVIMIEAGANEIVEEKMIEAIYKCHEVNQTIIAFINQICAEVGAKHEYATGNSEEPCSYERIVTRRNGRSVFTDENRNAKKTLRQ